MTNAGADASRKYFFVPHRKTSVYPTKNIFRIFVEHPKIKSHQGVDTNTRKLPCYWSSSRISKNIKFMSVAVIYR